MDDNTTVAPVEQGSHTYQQTDRDAGDSNDVTHLLSLGESALATYWNEGDVVALARAAASFRSAMQQAHENIEEKIRAQIGLADALRLEVDEGTGSDGHHDDSLSLARGAADAATSFPALFPEAVRALGEVLLDRSRDKTTERLQLAVDTFRQLVDLTSDARPDITVRSLALYAQSLNGLWYLTGDSKVLESANSTVDRAMSVCSGNVEALDPYLGFAFMMARAYRCLVTGAMDDVADAIEMSKQIISNYPLGHPWLCRMWTMLGALYDHRTRLVRGPDGHDGINLQLHAYSEAMKLVRPANKLYSICYGNYATGLHRRFVSQSNMEDLDEAISISRTLVALAVETGYQPENRYLNAINLSSYLRFRYAQTGNLDALDEAVTLLLAGLNHMPPVFQGMALGNLGENYLVRYKVHGRIADLEKAISFLEQSFPTSGRPYSNFIQVSGDLAEALLDRYDQLGQRDDMERAMSVLKVAVAHPDQRFKDSIYSLLGYVLLKKGATTQDLRDIEESIQCQRTALDLYAEFHAERAESYHRLGLAEYGAFIIDQGASSLQNCQTAYSQALSVMALDHPNRARFLLDLATSQLAAADTRGYEDLNAVFKTLGEAAVHTQSWPSDRYAAAALWARTAHRAGCLEIALRAYKLAISLLPQVAWLGLEDELRLQHLSRQPPDISQDAAACAIELGHYNLAVEIVDGSRSILWNTSQELRAELGKLKEIAPELAQELAQTNAALACRVPHEQDELHVEFERRRLHRLATRRAELLALVRSIPGFQNFLVPPSYDLLCPVGRGGSIVVLISSVYRCDALIVQDGKEATLVPLPEVTHRLVLAQAEALQKSLRLTADRRGRDFLDKMLLRILRDLWERIGKPICLALGQQTYGSPLRRIWWCPTGALTLLPIHACGPYNGQDPNMMDLFVSSYTPTLAALLRSQNKANLPRPAPPRILVVCQPETPNRPSLPCAKEEARVLYKLLPSLCTFRIGQEGTVVRVKEMLREHSWFHISTHGSQNSNKPLDSSIALYDGDLKLSDLAQERIPNADFAFLSACHSARSTQVLPDEAMHLAAGMMFAGFKSVVATSWAIADKDAPVVAEVFYRHLARDGKVPVVMETAEALHLAVKHLRDSGVPFFRWVPFIHLGT